MVPVHYVPVITVMDAEGLWHTHVIAGEVLQGQWQVIHLWHLVHSTAAFASSVYR